METTSGEVASRRLLVAVGCYGCTVTTIICKEIIENGLIPATFKTAEAVKSILVMALIRLGGA